MFLFFIHITVTYTVLANLTGHQEKVGLESFELLKVLGTGGELLTLNFVLIL